MENFKVRFTGMYSTKIENVEKDDQKFHILTLEALKIGRFRSRSVKERIGKYLYITMIDNVATICSCDER